MVKRPRAMNAFEFSVLAGLRAAQLIGGCAPRVDRAGKLTVTAQHEIAEYKVVRLPHGGSSDAID
jgi:DNA-directed RNA polymerase subunit K/omega